MERLMCCELLGDMREGGKISLKGCGEYKE